MIYRASELRMTADYGHIEPDLATATLVVESMDRFPDAASAFLESNKE